MFLYRSCTALCLTLLFLSIFALTTLPVLAGSPPVFSSDCERDPLQEGWTNIGWAEYEKNLVWVDDDVHSGAHCLGIVRWPHIPVGGGWESPPFPVEPAQYYRLTYWAKTSKPAFVGVVFYNQTGALTEGDNYAEIPVAGQWTERTLVFATKYPGVTAAVVFQPQSGHSLLFDDMRVDAISRVDARRWAERIAGEMLPIGYAPPPDAGRALPRTGARLRRGESLRVVLLGDSIANDVSNSLLDVLLEGRFPRTRLEMRFTGKGGTGWLKYQQQIRQRILNHQPDLVILEAISNEPRFIRDNLTRIITTVRQASPRTEFLLVTPHLQSWLNQQDCGIPHREALAQVAREQQVEYIDLMSAWQGYLARTGKPVESLLRDVLHMNDYGRQLSAQVLAAYLAQAAQRRK